MDTIFVNSENSKTSDIYRLLLNFTDKIDLKGRDKYVVLSNLNMHNISQNIKKSFKNSMKWKIWSYWWIAFCIRHSTLLWIQFRKHGEKTDNVSIRIHVNKIGNIIIFKIKRGYYLEL